MVLATLAMILTGCGLSGFRYLTHTQAAGPEMYVKLPTSWTVFSRHQLVEAAKQAKQKNVSFGGPGWFETFDGSPHAEVSASTLINGWHPSGIVEARPLGAKQRDQISLARLRTELLPSDPLNPPSPDPYTVLSYSTFTRPGGFWGNKMVVDIKDQAGAVSTFDQQAVVDNQTRWVYLIAVSCRAACYAAYQGQINQVMSSWGIHTG